MQLSVHSYRFKLLVYTVILMVLLLGTLFYTYSYVRNLLIEENNQHLTSMTRLLQARIETEKTEFQRYADIVADNVQFREYMFAVVDIGTDAGVLQELYDHQFGWLPVDRICILDRNDKIITGDAHRNITLIPRSAQNPPESGSYYVYGDKGLELIAYSPVHYQDNYLGTIVVSHLMDKQWFMQQQRESGGDIFLLQNNRLLSSSVHSQTAPILQMKQNAILIGKEKYRVHPLSLTPGENNLPQLYFALQETLLFERLARHQNVMSFVLTLSFLLILILGYFIVQNFNRPLTRLVSITNEVARGHLPHLGKSSRKDEIAVLSNHFADMLQALRDKQDEIEAVHAELEKTAITDSLTELYNRRQLSEIFPKLLGQAQRNGQMLFGTIIDLDKFKDINDLHGHLCGDACLQHFSALLRENSRANDYLFRLGGEEFLVLTTGDDEAGAFNQAEKIRIAIEQSYVHYENNTLRFTISCGISNAELTEDATTCIRNMLTRADKALFRAKNSGRNQVQQQMLRTSDEIQPSLFS